MLKATGSTIACLGDLMRVRQGWHQNLDQLRKQNRKKK